MIRRRPLLLFLLFAALLVAAFGVWIVLPHPGVTRANIARIEEGMTRHEVESLLGGKPAEHPAPQANCIGFPVPYPAKIIVGEYWWGGDVAVIVRFDNTGRVSMSQMLDIVYTKQTDTFLDRIRRWLGF